MSDPAEHCSRCASAQSYQRLKDKMESLIEELGGTDKDVKEVFQWSLRTGFADGFKETIEMVFKRQDYALCVDHQEEPCE